MKAVFLHKDDELLIIRDTKNILRQLNSLENSLKAFPFFPIFIQLQDQSIKTSEIAKIQVEKACVLDQKIIYPVLFELKCGSITQGQLVTGTVSEHVANCEICSTFQKQLRVFQVADIKKTGCVFEIQKPVWIKIR